MGNEAGKYIRGGSSSEGSSANNICIGYTSGPYTITSSHPSFITGGDNSQPTPISGRLYIDTGKRGTYRSGFSLLYGVQQSSGSSTSDSLSLNANVTINNLNSSSEGSLTVTGITYLENTTYLDDDLKIRDSSNNIKITLGSNGSGKFSRITSITDNTSSTNTSSGALKVTGGVGIGQNLNVGDNLTVGGTTTLTGNTTINGGTSINSTTNIDGHFYIRDSSDSNKFVVDHTNGNTTISGNLSITSGTTGNSVTTGALTVGGDVGINGNIRLPNLVTDSAAMNFGGGYPTGGVTIYKSGTNLGHISVRKSIRFYESGQSGYDGYVTLKAPASWDQETAGHGTPEYTLTLPLVN